LGWLVSRYTSCSIRICLSWSSNSSTVEPNTPSRSLRIWRGGGGCGFLGMRGASTYATGSLGVFATFSLRSFHIRYRISWCVGENLREELPHALPDLLVRYLLCLGRCDPFPSLERRDLHKLPRWRVWGLYTQWRRAVSIWSRAEGSRPFSVGMQEEWRYSQALNGQRGAILCLYGAESIVAVPFFGWRKSSELHPTSTSPQLHLARPNSPYVVNQLGFIVLSQYCDR
jgi:hypothetical protein